MCGVPIASVRVGVMPELVVHGANGFLIDQDPEQLALSMVWAAEHRDELRTMRAMMAEQAYAYLSWETRVYEWIEFITGDSDESAE